MSKKKTRKSGACKLYTLKVSLMTGPAHLGSVHEEISRTFQIRGDQTLELLHETIFDAFDREEEHMYEFKLADGRRYSLGPETLEPAGDVEENAMDSLGLETGQRFAYWFDFGDCWEHEIEVVSISDAPSRGHFPTVTAQVGESPAQYPQWDDEGLDPR